MSDYENFADMDADYDIGEKHWKKNVGPIEHNKYTTMQRHYVDNPTLFPRDCAQKIFSKLEIDLINNAMNTWAMIRVLMKYRKDVESIIEKTPVRVIGSTVDFTTERKNLVSLLERIRVEEGVLFNSIAFTKEIIYKIFDDEYPTYSEKLCITESTMKKMWKSDADFTLEHLCCNKKFQRQYKFPENVMLTQSGDIR